MARLFDDALSENLIITPAISTSPPFTMACWFNSNDDNAAQYLMSSGDVANEVNYYFLSAEGAVGGNIYVGIADGTASYAITTAGYSVNTWHHACGVFAADDDRAAFLDGGNKGTNSDSKTPTNLDNLSIGALYKQTPYGFMSGLIAEAAMWNIALTDDEVLILSKGYSPLFVHPQNLIAYWPLIRGLNDKVGGYNLTATGTVVSSHCRIILPSGPF